MLLLLCTCCVCFSHPGDVNLADHVFFRGNVFAGFGDEDAFALAPGVWLADVRLVFFGPGVSLEVAVAAECDQMRS